MKKFFFILFFIGLILQTSCQVRDPVPLKAGDETNKFLDKRNQKSGGVDNKKPADPTGLQQDLQPALQHSLFALERQSQLVQLLLLTEKLSSSPFAPDHSCLKVQTTKSEDSIFYEIDLLNCRFDYDQTTQSQSGRFTIETKKDFIRIQTLSNPESLRLKTIVRKSGKPTFATEDLLIEADKTQNASQTSYHVKTFAISSFLKSKNENTELQMNASGWIQLSGHETAANLEAQFTGWNNSVIYQTDSKNGSYWTLNLDMQDQDFLSENLNICGSRKASLHLTYDDQLSESKTLALLSVKENMFALEKVKNHITAPDCTQSPKPTTGIWTLPWGRVIQ